MLCSAMRQPVCPLTSSGWSKPQHLPYETARSFGWAARSIERPSRVIRDVAMFSTLQRGVPTWRQRCGRHSGSGPRGRGPAASRDARGRSATARRSRPGPDWHGGSVPRRQAPAAQSRPARRRGPPTRPGGAAGGGNQTLMGYHQGNLESVKGTCYSAPRGFARESGWEFSGTPLHRSGRQPSTTGVRPK